MGKSTQEIIAERKNWKVQQDSKTTTKNDENEKSKFPTKKTEENTISAAIVNKSQFKSVFAWIIYKMWVSHTHTHIHRQEKYGKLKWNSTRKKYKKKANWNKKMSFMRVECMSVKSVTSVLSQLMQYKIHTYGNA